MRLQGSRLARTQNFIIFVGRCGVGGGLCGVWKAKWKDQSTSILAFCVWRRAGLVVETPVPCMGEEGMKPKREKGH